MRGWRYPLFVSALVWIVGICASAWIGLTIAGYNLQTNERFGWLLDSGQQDRPLVQIVSRLAEGKISAPQLLEALKPLGRADLTFLLTFGDEAVKVQQRRLPIPPSSESYAPVYKSLLVFLVFGIAVFVCLRPRPPAGQKKTLPTGFIPAA